MEFVGEIGPDGIVFDDVQLSSELSHHPENSFKLGGIGVSAQFEPDGVRDQGLVFRLLGLPGRYDGEGRQGGECRHRTKMIWFAQAEHTLSSHGVSYEETLSYASFWNQKGASLPRRVHYPSRSSGFSENASIKRVRPDW